MSKPSRIFLVRHGQSVGNIDRTTYNHTPDWQVPLTETGRQQARAAGLLLRDDLGAVPGQMCNVLLGSYVSPYRRTRETWDHMLRGVAPVWPAFVKEDPRLREQEWGNLRTFDKRRLEEIEAERDAYGPFFFRFAHGESGADVYDRCTGFLDTLYRDFQKADMPDNVLIVTHGFTLRVLLMRWLHWSVEQFHGLSNPRNCERFELRLGDDGRYQLAAPFPTDVERSHHALATE